MRSLLLVSWVFLVPILLIEEISVVSGECLGDQRALLLQLKNSLTFNATQSKKLVQWDQNSDCCLWAGVICDEKGHVVSLNLSNESISKGIDNSSLFNLGHLQRLDLSYNSFNSTIPSSIGNLTTLTYLNLSNAGFGGQIPKEISQLVGLFTLDISTLSFLRISSFKLENPNLTMIVQNLSKLENLYLDGVNISAQGREWCQALSSSLHSLRVVSLTNCYLSGPIDSSLLELRNLSVIRLDNNNLSSPVPELLSRFLNLTSLRMSSCGLYGSFPQKIFQIPTLQNIDVSNNKLLEGSLPEFTQHNALQRLVLTATNFTGTLPSSIGNLSKLSMLDLSSCRFGGILPKSMEQLSQLVHLDLSNNKFNGEVPSLKMLKNLTEISLSHNRFTGAISFGWEGLNKLVVLELRNNSFNGSIPATLFSLPSLKQIQLSNNQFGGHLPQIPDVSSSVLDTIDISSNNLEGPIPLSIFHLPKLAFLSLSHNNLSGAIKLDSSQGLRNLTTLDLSYNNLFVNASDDSSWSLFTKISTLKLASCKLKKFPNLKSLSKLVYLDLSENQIVGNIPNWIWGPRNGPLLHLNLSHNFLVGVQEPYSLPSTLSVFDLHQNKLRGEIPVLPPQAIYIDLSSNQISSRIPSDIGNHLSSTYFFSLSNNIVEGSLPKSICNAGSIQVLDLSNNTLDGKIPDCMSSMSQVLAVLNLRMNNFTGQIPDAFPVQCGLKTFDLSRNSIAGQVPKSLANCAELEVLNLGNNNLSDIFPCMLKKISTLRVLVLRWNSFYGRLGCHHINGTWKMLQIIDLSHNNFSGELPGKCLKNWQAMKDDGYDYSSKLNHIRFQVLWSSSYQDTIIITFKGLELEIVKIVTVLTSIDLSCNNFSGSIPTEVGQLNALYLLNLSHNALTGDIPSSIGNLQKLESLDLSNNSLSGEIPATLANLTFLQLLNLSFNQLVGRIPTGAQLQTFSNDSYEGNKALCGFPLTRTCNNTSNPTSQSDAGPSFWSDIEFDWLSIYSGIGFGVGAGAVVALLMLCHEGKYWFEDCIDDALLAILPRLGYSYRPRDEWDNDEVPSLAEDHDETAMEDNDSQGQFCVFCSKLDITMKRAIHDLNCICHSSPPMSSSSRSSSRSSSSLQ